MPTMLQSLVVTATLGASIAASSATPQVVTLELSIPTTDVRDEFYAVNVNFTGQTLPLLLDTGSSDILVASDQCNRINKTSGCYNSKLFQIPKDLTINKHQHFSSVVGSGPVNGNQSIMSVGFDKITVNDLAVPLIYAAAEDEFQDGSFSGILGVGMLNVSREYHYFRQLPPFNKMAADRLLEKPVFSITVPRYGDPASPKFGNLTIGGIQSIPSHLNVTYSDIIATSTTGKKKRDYNYETWTQELQGFRINGHELSIPKQGLGEKGQFIATMDTGGEKLFVGALFEKAAKYFTGKTQIVPDVFLYFDCSQPQLVEFKFNGQWIPIDPLDMIQPGEVKTVNGTEMCLSTLQAGNSAYSNVLLGPQFFRNSVTVFDYVSEDLFSVPPRVGVAPTTDADAAIKRYPGLYKNRLH